MFSFKPTKNIITHEYLTNEYVLAFDNWKIFKMRNYKDNLFYEFSFTHQKGSLYIENMAIILSGNNERIEEMWHKTDLSLINKGQSL